MIIIHIIKSTTGCGGTGRAHDVEDSSVWCAVSKTTSNVAIRHFEHCVSPISEAEISKKTNYLLAAKTAGELHLDVVGNTHSLTEPT